jgi:2-C-methyl-D-erythritol 4-phosphate cytidylyltransferase/2-C-methyl-D-erythritol 2,4-cyclodiphosphate synthase
MVFASRIAVILVAAGSGSRLGGDIPKVYQPLEGTPLLRRAAQAFARMGVQTIQPVIHPDFHAHCEAALTGVPTLAPVAGGATRQESVRAGLEALAAHAPDHVLIHDAARALISPALIQRIIDALAAHDAVVPALPVYDTLRNGAGDDIPREGVLRMQTPQAFRFADIAALHQEGPEGVTDDAALWLASGKPLHYVTGEEINRKITVKDDMVWAEAQLAAQRITKAAMGFDVHQTVPQQAGVITLGGVTFDAPVRLKGHSDADVVLHALTDGLLGSIAAGDIGQHFPPSDPQWKGAASEQFVQHAMALLAEKQAVLRHVDMTIICESPKIGPVRDAIRDSIARMTALPLHAVSVKATTTEGLGFTGRGEGVACQAIVSVEVPHG